MAVIVTDMRNGNSNYVTEVLGTDSWNQEIAWVAKKNSS